MSDALDNAGYAMTKAMVDGISMIANAIKAPDANNGDAAKHGNDDHDTAIDEQVQELIDAGYTDVRKNQQQVDADGNKVGTNRPDVQGTNPKTKQREYWEFDHNAKNSKAHEETIQSNDPSGKVHPVILEN